MNRCCHHPTSLRLLLAAALTLGMGMLASCAVVSVAGTAVSVGASAVGLAVDVGVGAAKLTGKAVGAVVDAASDDDNSGVNIRFREPTPADREKRRMAEQQAEEEDRRAAQPPTEPR